jgi:hypothetical protein
VHSPMRRTIQEQIQQDEGVSHERPFGMNLLFY